MNIFAVILLVALLFSSVGFKKYVWFISIGYGFSIAAIGAALLIRFSDQLSLLSGIACVLLKSGISSIGFLITGILVMVPGLIIESVADIQKAGAKKKNPARFVDTGLYRSVLQWILSLIGYIGIIYVMFGGARRLELRQNRTYGDDPEYQTYVKKLPIMIPFIPLYSVAKYKWLVA